MTDKGDEEIDVKLTLAEVVSLGLHLNNYLERMVPVVQKAIKEHEESNEEPTQEYLELVQKTSHVIKVHEKLHAIAEKYLK